MISKGLDKFMEEFIDDIDCPLFDKKSVNKNIERNIKDLSSLDKLFKNNYELFMETQDKLIKLQSEWDNLSWEKYDELKKSLCSAIWRPLNKNKCIFKNAT